MDSENNFTSILEEPCSYNLENFFKDSEWSSLGGLSQISYSKDILLLKEDDNKEENDVQTKKNPNIFSRKIHSRMDEFYQRRILFFEKIATSNSELRNRGFSLPYIKNSLLEESATSPYHDTSLPGMKPSSSWPVCLTDLTEKIKKLEIKDLFHEPFDNEGNFQKQSEEYINNSFKNKSFLEHLPSAISAYISMYLLYGSVERMNSVFDFLKKMKKEYKEQFDKIFLESSKLFLPVLKKVEQYYQELPSNYPILKNYQFSEVINICKNNLYLSSKYSFHQCSSVTCDGTYLYLVLTGICGSMMKIGTGFNNTDKGRIYYSKSISDDDYFQWVYLKGKLYAKIGSTEEITIFDTKEFKNLGKIKILLPENVKHPALKRKNDNFVLMSDGEKLQAILIEPVLNENAKKVLPKNINTQMYDEDEEDECKISNSKEDLYDTFTDLNLIILSYDVSTIEDSEAKYSLDSASKINSIVSAEKQSLIKELHESFSYYFSYENCHRALAMFNWDFQKAALYLIDNSEQVQEDILIADTKKVIATTPLEGLKVQNGYVEFRFKNNIENNRKSIDLNGLNGLKWVNTGKYIIAYKIMNGECDVFDQDGYIGKFPSVQMNKIDYLMTYDSINQKYYIISNYSFVTQSIIVGDCLMDTYNDLEKKIKDDLGLELILGKKDSFNLEEFEKEINNLFLLFSLRKNLTYWKYENWNYFYGTYLNNLVYNKRDIDQKNHKKFNSMVKNLVHKTDKFRVINEKELISQLEILYPDIKDYDLDLEGKYYKPQSYEKLPVNETINWCSWTYTKSFLFEKIKPEQDTKEEQKDEEKEPEKKEANKEEEKDNKDSKEDIPKNENTSKIPNSVINTLYLENKIISYFSYPGSPKFIDSFLSTYKPSEELLFLYKALIIIQNLDLSFLISPHNKRSFTTTPLTPFYNTLKTIYTSTQSETSKRLIEMIFILGYEFFFPTLQSQLDLLELFRSSTSGGGKLSLSTNSQIDNIYGILLKGYNSVDVLVEHISRLYKPRFFPLSFEKMNNMKILAVTKYEDKIYGNVLSQGINPKRFQTPFYYALCDSEKMEQILKTKKKTFFKIFHVEKAKNEAQKQAAAAMNKTNPFGQIKRKNSGSGFLYNFSSNMFSTLGVSSLEDIFQISGIINGLTNCYENEPNIKDKCEKVKDFAFDDKCSDKEIKTKRIKLLIEMEYHLFSELSLLSRYIQYEEDSIELSSENSKDEEKNEPKEDPITLYNNYFIEMVISHFNSNVTTQIGNFDKWLNTYHKYILFYFITMKISSISMSHLLKISQFFSSILSKPPMVESASSNGYQVELEKTFEYTINQGEYIKICEVASFANSLAVIVEIDLRCTNDVKPSFDIVLISKENPYNKINSNNNVGNFGTCFCMKLNTLTSGKKYVLLGDEIKIMTQPENSFNSRSNNYAKNGRYSKSILKIRCYPLNEKDFIMVEDKKVKKIENINDLFELKFANEVDYFVTLISKFFIRSISLSEGEKMLLKDKYLSFIIRYGLSNPSIKEDDIFKFETGQFSTVFFSSLMKKLLKNAKPPKKDGFGKYLGSIDKAVNFVTKDNSNENAVKEIEKIDKLRKKIRDIVNEPINYGTLKKIPSFNEKMKTIWLICENYFMLCLLYHLNLVNDIDKLCEDIDQEPFYLEYIGKKMNGLVQWMSGRVQYLKDTFDNVKNYSILIVEMNNKFVENLKKLVIERVIADNIEEKGKKDNKGKDEESKKDGEKDKTIKKVRKNKFEIFDKKFGTKNSNYKKKANVSRLYTDLPKSKHLKKKDTSDKKSNAPKKNDEVPGNNEEKANQGISIESLSSLSLNELLTKYPKYKTEFVNSENIKKLKEEILAKIESDIKESYFGNIDKLKSVCEVYDITFSESNLTDALKSYTNLIKGRLTSVYQFTSYDKIEFLDENAILEKIYANSPYMTIATNIINKLSLLFEVNNDATLDIKDKDAKNNLALTFSKSTFSNTNNVFDDTDVQIPQKAKYIVQCIFNVIQKSKFDTQNVKLCLYTKLIRDLIRQKGFDLLSEYDIKHGDQFANSYGIISSGFATRSSSMTLAIKAHAIINAYVLQLHKQIDLLNVDLKTDEYHSTILKNINLILNDLNVILTNQLKFKCEDNNDLSALFDIKTIISKALGIIINDEMKFNLKLARSISEFILNFRSFLSNLVKLDIIVKPSNDNVTNMIIESLLEALDKVTEYDKNVNLVSSLLDIIYHIMINIDSKDLSLQSKNNTAFTKGLDKLLGLILNSSTPQLVSLSVKIGKLFLRNSKIGKSNFIALFDKLGKFYNLSKIETKEVDKEEKKYNILIEMNSPEIDYNFLINALYQWEELYPTNLSEYKKDAKIMKENELKVVTPPGKEISHFNPLRKKESKTAKLENIVNSKIDIYKARLIEINDLIQGKEQKNKEEKSEEKKEEKEEKKDEKIKNKKKQNEDKVQQKEDEKKEIKKEEKKEDEEEEKKKEEKGDKEQKKEETKPEASIQLSPEVISELLAEIDLINIKLKYLSRILGHIKLCYKIGECASTRGYVIIENKFPKAIAEQFQNLIMSAFYNLTSQIPNEESLDIEGKCIVLGSQFFKPQDLHPPFPTMEQLLPGCTNILKEITKSYLSCLLVEANEIYPKLNNSISSFASKTANDNSITQTQSKMQSVSTNVNEMSQHIVDCGLMTGESVTCIIDYINELISFAISKESENEIEYETYISSIISEKKYDELLGLLIHASGGVNIIRSGTKCQLNDGTIVTVVGGGCENGMKTVNVVFDASVNGKAEKIAVEEISKGIINYKVINCIDYPFIINLFIELYNKGKDEKTEQIKNLILYLLRCLDAKIKAKKSNENDLLNSLTNPSTVDTLKSILKEITQNANWISDNQSVLERNLISAFERKLTSQNPMIYQIYSPPFIDFPLSEEKKSVSQSNSSTIDMIKNYTLPDSSYVSQLPPIEDTSKSCLALKNIAQFERYTVEEVFNYAKSHYNDNEYFFYLRQVRQELSFNDITNAKNDIYVIFDQSKVPPGMPFPQEHRDMKEIFKEECYPNNFYLAKMTHKLIRETGIKSLQLTSSPQEQNENKTDTQNESPSSSGANTTTQNAVASQIKEIPVLVLLVDNSIEQAFVMYNDYIYCNVHTFWISISHLSLLDFNMKLPPNAIDKSQIENEYYTAYNDLYTFYAKSIMCGLYEELLEAFKVNDIDEMSSFINLALWRENMKDPIDGILKRVKNYIQVKKKDNSENISLKKLASSRVEANSPANSGVYQPKCDINHILSHLNKKSTFIQTETAVANATKTHNDTEFISALNKIERELRESETECFSLENLATQCIEKIKKFSHDIIRIRIEDLFKEYHKAPSSKPLFTIATMGSKLLSLHLLCGIDNVRKYCGCIISFEQTGVLGPNAKLNFYGDKNAQILLKELSSPKTSRTDVESAVFNQSEVYLEYIEGTTAFYINDWNEQSRDSVLPCFITYIPCEWLYIVYLIDYVSSAIYDQGEYDEHKKLKIFQKLISELLILCTSQNIPAELQQNIFTITNRVILKAIKFVSIEKKVNKNNLSINEKFSLIGFDEMSVIGIIKNIDNCIVNKQHKNFSSSYIVDQVEILLAILSFIQESYLSLETYLREVFEYNLPLWIEAIIKLGNFLSFLQGNTTLEPNLMNEIKEQIDINANNDFIEKNIFVIKGIKDMKEEEIYEKVYQCCKVGKCRVANKISDIKVIDSSNVVILIDGFNVEELKEIPDEVVEVKEEPKEEFWVCSCGFDNVMENEFCCACDKERPAPKEKKTTLKKKQLIKNESYTLKVEDMSNDFVAELKKINKVEDNKEFSVNTLKNILITKEKENENEKDKENSSLINKCVSTLKNILITKEKDPDIVLINKFLMLRLINLISDEDYYNEYLIQLGKECEVISNIKKEITTDKVKFLENIKNNTQEIANISSFNYYSYYKNLQTSKKIDVFHSKLSLPNEAFTSPIDLSLMERIRELVDITLCKETNISYVYPPSAIRFVPSQFTSIDHSQTNIIENFYKDLISIPLIKIRFYWAIIRYFNSCLISALPFIKPPDPYSMSFSNREDNDYIYISFPKTISMFLSSAKGVTLSTTKNNLINDVLSFTEYSPEEVQIPTFKFERLAIANTTDVNSENGLNSKLLTTEESLFLQAYEQGKDIDPAFYRSSKVPGDPHIGFKIEFKGELVQGIGGPYRQFFSDISNELIPNDKNAKKLGLFCPTANNIAQTGEAKNKFTITPSYNSNTELNHYEFLGIIMGVCIRTGVHIPLDLCSLIWKKLTDTPINVEDIKELDEGIIEQINFISEIDAESFGGYGLNYSCELSDGTLYDLIPNGKYEHVLYEDRGKYMELFLKARLTESDKQISYIKKGLNKLIPPSLLKLLTHKELERFVSGSLDKDIDIELLKSFTKYSMELTPTTNRIKWLWELLEEFTPTDRRKFIKFCWAQERLPATKDEYERLQVVFTIKPCMDKKRVDVFPKADTCFFSLELPEYSSKDVMKNKILTAINLDNVSINADKASPYSNMNERSSGMYNDDYDDDDQQLN